jgi:hypothetical protein
LQIINSITTARAGDPVIRITQSHTKLCPVHGSFIALSGRAARTSLLRLGIVTVPLNYTYD